MNYCRKLSYPLTQGFLVWRSWKFWLGLILSFNYLVFWHPPFHFEYLLIYFNLCGVGMHSFWNYKIHYFFSVYLKQNHSLTLAYLLAYLQCTWQVVMTSMVIVAWAILHLRAINSRNWMDRICAWHMLRQGSFLPTTPVMKSSFEQMVSNFTHDAVKIPLICSVVSGYENLIIVGV